MRKFAVFDIDGTLIRWQLYHAVVDALGKKGILKKNSYSKILAYRMEWKQREDINAFEEYENILIDVYEEALPGIDVKLFDQLAQEVADRYKTQVYAYTRNLITNLKKQNYILLAISGSHTELVSHIARQYKFDDWVGTVYGRNGQYFTGNKTIASKNKRQILDRLIQKHNLSLNHSIGVGDSLSDVGFLEVVENPIAFNPNQQLYHQAKLQGWKIVIERKNVIFELENKNGQYILV